MNQCPSQSRAPAQRHPPGRIVRRLLVAIVGLAWLWVSELDARSATLIATNSVWKYFASGREPAPNWASRDYADASWPEGPAQFGYGDGDESTVLTFGPNPESRYITTYFRGTVILPNPAEFNQITLRVLRDDGVAVHLNGNEVFRNNLPAEPLRYETLAGSNVVGSSERTYYTASFPAGRLLDFTNVVAVEIHQASPQSVDLSFDMEMTASDANQRTRGPYLQLGRTNSAVVRWRTAIPTDTLGRCGTNQDELSIQYYDAALITDHVIPWTGLQPDTRYFYTVGSSGAENLNEYFSLVTAPAQAKPTRIWAIGDSGTGTLSQRKVRDAYTAFAQGRHTDVWLMLGDNAYGAGTDAQYQSAVFDTYPELLSSTFLWPAIGNHDVYAATAPDQFPYLDIFTLPAAGEAGGVPSGTEKFYSFEYGNIHFVCLDAMSSDRSSDGMMGIWLREDLSVTTAEWLIAYWHHPPYSAGSHNSDVESELIEMRQNMLPILESYGVDLVLCGHSHSYERSYFLNGYYGISSTLQPSMVKDPGDGREFGTGPYVKPSEGAVQGTVYVVAGNAGQISGGTLDHPAMAISLNRLGSVVLDVDGLRLDARFLRETGEIDDSFTIVKSDLSAPLRLVSFQLRQGQVRVLWKSDVGATYRVEKASRLENPLWLSASGNYVAANATSFWSEPVDSGAPQTFYRVIRVP